MLDNEQLRDINMLSRKEIVDILEDYCIACYDSESTDLLRQSLISNIEDGTISFCEVEMLF